MQFSVRIILLQCCKSTHTARRSSKFTSHELKYSQDHMFLVNGTFYNFNSSTVDFKLNNQAVIEVQMFSFNSTVW